MARSFASLTRNLVFLAALSCAGWPLPAQAEVEIVRLWVGYRETGAFARLREFITGREAPRNVQILRSDPDDRAGFYYTVRLADRATGVVPDGNVVLQVVAPQAGEARTFTFPFESGSRREVRLEIGVTGDDWTYGKALPLAWRLEVRSRDGRLLASRDSFLWAAPDRPSS